MLTIKQILDGKYLLNDLSEYDYEQIRTVLYLKVKELQDKKGKTEKEWDLMRRLQQQQTNLIDHGIKKEELECARCLKSATWNTPFLDMETKEILCSTCAHDDTSGHLLRGIEQRTNWHGDLKFDHNLEHMRNGNIVWVSRSEYGFHTGPGQYEGHHVMMCESMPDVDAWVNKGHTAFPLTDEEKLLAIQDPVKIFNLMDQLKANGQFRCTTCGGTFLESECAGHPLFAGKTCEPCWKKHLKHLEDEKKHGHVCSLCGEPYGNCCC